MNTATAPEPLDVDETPAPRTRAEIPADDRVRAIADALDCVLDEDVQILANVTRWTTEKWRKSGTGPPYTFLGNRPLYPRSALRAFLEEQARARMGRPAPKSLL